MRVSDDTTAVPEALTDLIPEQGQPVSFYMMDRGCAEGTKTSANGKKTLSLFMRV